MPDLRRRVWGGERLTPPGEPAVGEAWLAGGASVVDGGPLAGSTLDALAAAHGTRLTGSAASRPDRFPLLVKLLDPADWLSVQVHPDDAQAKELEGPEAVGKTEAWYVVEASEGAEILLGVRASATPDAVRAAITHGGLPDLLERRRVTAGEAYLVPAGTLHAVGPGSLVYEIQEPSDITYRCDDWGRPATAGRPLHTAQSLACVQPTPWTIGVRSLGADAGPLVDCDHFVLEALRPRPGRAVARDTGLASVHVLTAISGAATVRGDDWSERIEPFATLVVPAEAGRYRLESADGQDATVLLGRLPS
ncbi:MAG TPA: type I phosphomannose isomerase catalytic subunit [Candidatus Limnocylindrales bacterium]